MSCLGGSKTRPTGEEAKTDRERGTEGSERSVS